MAMYEEPFSHFLNELIGLSFHNYTFTFYVKKNIEKYDAKTQNFGLPEINDDGCSFSFTMQIEKKKLTMI